jgi:hypothetical protein
MGEKRNAYGILVGKPGGNRPLQRPRRRWEENIKMELIEIGWGGMDWICRARDRDQWRAFVNTAINLRGPYNVGKFSGGCAAGGFSRRAQLHGVSYVDRPVTTSGASAGKSRNQDYLIGTFLARPRWLWTLSFEVNGDLYDLRFSHRWSWRALSSGLYCRVVCWKSTYVSEEHVASVCRAEE